MKVKEKDPFKKYKLIFSLELLLIALVFLILGLLKILGIMKSSSTRILVFNWITLFGGLWIIIDFIWLLNSKKRKAKNSLLDKILALPIALYVIPLDLVYIIKHPSEELFVYLQAGLFLYIFLIYTFEGIYHYYKPLPSLVIAYNEELKDKEELFYQKIRRLLKITERHINHWYQLF